MTLFAKQDAPNVPAYTIEENGEMVGTITDFPGEGVAYTVRALGLEFTSYEFKTIAAALEDARKQYAALLDGTSICYEEGPEWEDIEDEDGEIAAMRAAENAAERWAQQDEGYYYAG